VDTATGYWLEGPGSITGIAKFCLLHSFQAGSGAHPASYPMGIRGSFLGEKRTESETDLSPASNAEVKNDGSILPLPHTSS
jgi:hypothetical protein